MTGSSIADVARNLEERKGGEKKVCCRCLIRNEREHLIGVLSETKKKKKREREGEREKMREK